MSIRLNYRYIQGSIGVLLLFLSEYYLQMIICSKEMDINNFLQYFVSNTQTVHLTKLYIILHVLHVDMKQHCMLYEMYTCQDFFKVQHTDKSFAFLETKWYNPHDLYMKYVIDINSITVGYLLFINENESYILSPKKNYQVLLK